MKLYFVRHGESTANSLGVFSNGNCDHSLTDRGVAQARALALALHGKSINQVDTSPVLRAIQTAIIISDLLSVPLKITEALREWSVGIYDGTSDPLGWELHRKVQEDWFLRQDMESKLPGGESFVEIKNRCIPFFRELVQDVKDSEQNIVLVGHGGLYQAILPVILSNVDQAFARQNVLGYTDIVVVEVRESLYCISWCGISIDINDEQAA